MSTYEVGIEFDSTVYMLVEADSEDHAAELANARFNPSEYMDQIIDGAWITGGVELVDDGTEEETE